MEDDRVVREDVERAEVPVLHAAMLHGDRGAA
jgi:hypothetical protein